MNRADKLLAVLQDGRAHSRQDVFDAYGFCLTNNAASELRARGYDVEHRRKDGLDTYRLVGSSEPLPNPPRNGDASHLLRGPERDDSGSLEPTVQIHADQQPLWVAA